MIMNVILGATWLRPILFAGYLFAVILQGKGVAEEEDPILEPVKSGGFADDFRRVFFRGYKSEADVKQRLRHLVSKRINRIDLHCSLTDSQRQKLQLAGDGDIKHVFDRVDELQKRAVARGDFDSETERGRILSMLDGQVLPFAGNSLINKTVARLLTPEQAARFEEFSLDREQLKTVQPDRLSFGVVRQGAIVEASIRMIADQHVDRDQKVTLRSPSFLKVMDDPPDRFQNLGGIRPRVYDLDLAVDTSKLGDFRGALKVLIGSEWFAEIPIAATVVDKPGAKRVLVVETPFHKTSTDDGSRFDPWVEIVKTADLDVSYIRANQGDPVLRNLDLSKFDVVIVAQVGLCFAQPADFEKLTAFVKAGGRVIVAANHFFGNSVAKANEFLVPFGLKMQDVESSEGHRAIDCTLFADHKLTRGIREAKFFRGSPIVVEKDSNGMILVEAPTFPDSGFVAIARSGRGSVIALGASMWWNWIASDQEKGSDNHLLLKNLISIPVE